LEICKRFISADPELSKESAQKMVWDLELSAGLKPNKKNITRRSLTPSSSPKSSSRPGITEQDDTTSSPERSEHTDPNGNDKHPAEDGLDDESVANWLANDFMQADPDLFPNVKASPMISPVPEGNEPKTGYPPQRQFAEDTGSVVASSIRTLRLAHLQRIRDRIESEMNVVEAGFSKREFAPRQRTANVDTLGNNGAFM